MKNNILKILSLASCLAVGTLANAQAYYADANDPTKDLTVDIDPANGGQSPNGSDGSWYQWTVDNGATYVSPVDLEYPGKDSNKATITWGATWPGAGGNPLDLIKDYKIKAEEFNDCQTSATTESTVEIDVKLVKADILWIDYDTEYCSTGGKPSVTIHGTPGATVVYALMGSNDTAPIVIGNDGKITVEINPDDSGDDIVFTVDSVEFAGVQHNGNPFTCSSATISNTEGNTVTIKVGQAPTISDIEW